MTSKILAHTDSRRFVTAGDSMSIFGPILGQPSVSMYLNELHVGVPWVDEAVGGTFASQMLANVARITRWVVKAEQPIVMIVTGTNSYAFGSSGAAVYGQISDTAEAIKTAKASALVYATTCVPGLLITAGTKNNNRLAGNLALLADVDGFLDGVIDWAAESSLQSPGYDGTHFNNVQREYAAGVCDAVVFP